MASELTEFEEERGEIDQTPNCVDALHAKHYYVVTYFAPSVPMSALFS